MTEPARCRICDVLDPDGNSEGTLCRDCAADMAAEADDDARERAIDMRVEEHLDGERERQHGSEPPR